MPPTITTCPTPQSAETDGLAALLAEVNQQYQRTPLGTPGRIVLAARVRGLMSRLEAARAELAAGRAVQLFPVA